MAQQAPQSVRCPIRECTAEFTRALEFGRHLFAKHRVAYAGHPENEANDMRMAESFCLVEGSNYYRADQDLFRVRGEFAEVCSLCRWNLERHPIEPGLDIEFRGAHYSAETNNAHLTAHYGIRLMVCQLCTSSWRTSNYVAFVRHYQAAHYDGDGSNDDIRRHAMQEGHLDCVDKPFRTDLHPNPRARTLSLESRKVLQSQLLKPYGDLLEEDLERVVNGLINQRRNYSAEIYRDADAIRTQQHLFKDLHQFSGNYSKVFKCLGQSKLMSSLLRASTTVMVTECLQETAATFRQLLNEQLSSMAFVTLAKRCSSDQLLWGQFMANLALPVGNNAQLVTSTFGAHCIEDVLIHLHKTDRLAYFDGLVEVALPGNDAFTMVDFGRENVTFRILARGATLYYNEALFHRFLPECQRNLGAFCSDGHLTRIICNLIGQIVSRARLTPREQTFVAEFRQSALRFMEDRYANYPVQAYVKCGAQVSAATFVQEILQSINFFDLIKHQYAHYVMIQALWSAPRELADVAIHILIYDAGRFAALMDNTYATRFIRQAINRNIYYNIGKLISQTAYQKHKQRAQSKMNEVTSRLARKRESALQHDNAEDYNYDIGVPHERPAPQRGGRNARP